MSKVVCPDCGGNLILESLYQYGLQQRVSSTGKLCKRIKKVDNGSMDTCILFCAKCKRCFGEDEYTFCGDPIQLDIDMENDNDKTDRVQHRNGAVNHSL